MLSRQTQVTRLRRLAVRALDAYPIEVESVHLVTHGENTTFRVVATGRRTEGAPTGPEQLLLRVHRPSRHGRGVDSRAAVGSELAWLRAIRADTNLQVPEPVRTVDGADVTIASDPGVDGTRVCSLLRWMDGRIHEESPRPVHLRRLGEAMARLHDQADGWRPPAGFVRIRWDHETFFGDVMEYGGVPAGQVWDLLPGDVRQRFDAVAGLADGVMTDLGEGPDAWGLVHADLHLGNAVFGGGQVRLIDFDDSGYGHRVYEVAVALWELRHRDDYEHFRAALLDGYRSRRPIADDQLALLDMFIAVREVAFGLWYAGTAQVNPAFRDRLDRTLHVCATSIDKLGVV